MHGHNHAGGTDKKLPTPPATATHLPIRHTAVVETLIETPSHRHIGVVGDEFAVSSDAMETFGVLDLETSFEGMLCLANWYRESILPVIALRKWTESYFRDAPVAVKRSEPRSTLRWRNSECLLGSFAEVDRISQRARVFD